MMRFTVFFLLSLFTISLSAQTEVKGKVIDAETKEPIGYVNIRFKKSLVSNYSDPNGEFTIRTLDRVDSLQFSFIGYQTRTVKILRGKKQEMMIEMGSDNIDLTEVTVKVKNKKKVKFVDTTANYVYYKVLANRDENNPAKITTYAFDAHTKLELDLLNPRESFKNLFFIKPFRFVFENYDITEDGGIANPVIMRETISKNLFRRNPRTFKSIVLGDKISGITNESITRLGDQQFEEFDLYQDIYLIAAKSFVSPFSPGAILTYKYYLTDTQQIEGRTSYKLYFVGRVKEDLALKGWAWIDSAKWAVKYIQLKPNEKSNINFINEYSIYQQYTLVDKRQFMLSEEKLYTTAKIIPTKKSGSLLIRKTTLRKNFALDIPFPDSLYGGEKFLVHEKARTRSELEWDSMRIQPLTRTERQAYENVDSIMRTKTYKRYYWAVYLMTTAYFKIGPVDIGRFYKFVSRNSVEGIRLRIGGRTNQDFSKQFLVAGHVAYGLKDKDWKYELNVRYVPKTNSNRWHAFDFIHRYDLTVVGQENPLLTFDNFLTLLRRTPLDKVMKIRQTDLQYETDWFSGFTTIFNFSHKTYFSIPGTFDFQRPLNDQTRINIPRFTTTELSAFITWTARNTFYVSQFYRYNTRSKWPYLNFKYTASIPRFVDGEYHYHKLFFQVYQRLNHPLGRLFYDFRSGLILGNVPYAASFIASGNLALFWDSKTYNLMREYEFISDKFASLWLEQHFDGFFFNKIPYFNKLKLREVVHVKALIGDFSTRNRNLMILPFDISTPGPIPYVEAGFGIENILNIFRIDFLWRVTYRDKPNLPNWAIKLNINPGF